MSARRAVSATGDATLALLRLTAASVDVIPSLRSAAADVVHIAELVPKFRSNKNLWADFGAHVQDVTARVIGSLAETEAPQTNIRDNLAKLQTTLNQFAKIIESEQTRSRVSRLTRFMGDPDLIEDMKNELNNAIVLFELGAISMTEINVHYTLRAVIDNGKKLSGLSQATALISQNATLDKLRYVHGASWDPHRVCLPNTRVNITGDVHAWIANNDEGNQARVLLLTAVAGAGKSTIAHTVAQRCHERGQLVSSFFFDRETADRNNPAGLFSTIASGLSQVDKRLAAYIANAIETDQDLTRAPISRQFDELVLKPSLGCAVKGPLVIIIDALDEGWSDILLFILQDHVPRLPGAFSIVITSRVMPELEILRQKEHVSSMSIDVTALSNLQDIALFIPHKLKELADARMLGVDWPGEEQRAIFATRAGGLFLWVSTVCDYLRKVANPMRELKKLLIGPNQVTRSAEVQMDKLYAAILDSYDWDDEDFVAEYHRVVGTAIAAKTPLTVSALNLLFHEEPAVLSYVLQQLGPLLTGTSESDFETQPVRVLHQSFRDFIVLRAGSLPNCVRFQIVGVEHSQRLALLCLGILNRDLSDHTIGAGYLEKEESEVPGIPMIGGAQMPEALWYAYQFWINHLLDTRSPGALAVMGALRLFMEEKAVCWMEVMAAKSQFRGLSKIRKWWNVSSQNAMSGTSISFMSSQQEMDPEGATERSELLAKHANVYRSLSGRLGYEGRREEALESAEESVEIYRQLAADRPAAFSSDFAMSLNNLANTLSELGRREEALEAIEDSVEIFQQLAADRPAAFSSDLAMSLNNLSVYLSKLGRREEALKAIEDAVEIRRQLATDRPTTFSSHLADSLNNLSLRLSDLGRREEALKVIEDAVDIRRQLAEDRPVAFSSDLAISLSNLSLHLSHLGRREEALKAIEDAVEIYRQLAADRPAAFSSNLASSLNNSSVYLSDLGRHKEALKAIEDAVEIYRQLAADRPAAFSSDLADSLNTLSIRFSYLGSYEVALKAIEDAVEIYRQLAAGRPAAFTSHLAMSLNNLANTLSELGRREEAFKAIKEAVEIRRQLAADRPAVFSSDLAMSLNNLSLELSDLGRREEALKAIEDAVEIYRHLAADRPAAFSSDLATSLNTLSAHLSDLGRCEEALKAMEDAVEIYRQLAADRPAAFSPDLAMSLHNFSLRCSDLGNHQAALLLAQEALKLRRQLAKERPAVFAAALSRSLDLLSQVLVALERHEEAAAASEEAGSIRL